MNRYQFPPMSLGTGIAIAGIWISAGLLGLAMPSDAILVPVFALFATYFVVAF